MKYMGPNKEFKPLVADFLGGLGAAENKLLTQLWPIISFF